MLLPTPRAAVCVAALAAVAAVGIVVPVLRDGVWFLDAWMVLIAAVDAAFTPSAKMLQFRRSAPETAPRGEAFAVDTSIELAESARVAARLEFRNDVPESFYELDAETRVHLTPGSEAVVVRRYAASVRGAHVIGPTHVRIVSPFELFVRAVKLDGESMIQIQPRPALSAEAFARVRSFSKHLGSALMRRRGRATEFDQLREHVTGDEFRAIDWKASARRAVLTVREYRTERNREVMILLDAGRRMSSRFEGASKLDHALEAALGLSQAALACGDRVGLLAFARTPLLEVVPRRGAAHFGRIFSAVRALAAAPEESSLHAALRHVRARRSKRAFLLVITDLSDPLSARRWLPAFAALARRHYLLFAAVDDPERRALEDKAPVRVEDAYEIAGARRIRRERLEILAELRRFGVHAIDVPPRELAGPLLDTYLDAAAAEAF